MQQSIKYFVNGHTADGFVDYLHTNLNQLDQIIVLQHEKRIILTALFEELLVYFGDVDSLEVISHPQQKGAIAGIIIRDKQLAILDGAMVFQRINNAIYLCVDDVISSRENRIEPKKILDIQRQAVPFFKKGLMIHNQLEQVYIGEMDFAKADQIAETFINTLLKNEKNISKQSCVYERLFGTNTPDGMVNHVEELIAPIENVVHVKGRAGTGKSVFMKKVFRACKEYGFDIELYHCSFDPNSVDMVMVRELDFCIFDSTDPHAFDPKKKGEQMIDLYELTVTKGTDEKYANRIDQLTKAYKEQMRLGLKTLQQLQPFYRQKDVHIDGSAFLLQIEKMINA